MYQVFKDKGLIFQETTLTMSLADDQQTKGEVFTTQVMIEIEGRSVLTRFTILPKAKGNRTLLGTDFLGFAGLILDVKNACWQGCLKAWANWARAQSLAFERASSRFLLGLNKIHDQNNFNSQMLFPDMTG
ncbi:hypothetical protein NPIL_75991 [Nephila pilipes]|uniref:Uncharacterized protein n=1 Tax=Nephila pilipes TaxID=299642 RepID=A0A8X6KPZ7_NEPPI|nr:hypothetical protein NPIL_75991 [Nephila pilipes]